MNPPEPLHDLATRRRRLRIEHDPSPVYDLLLVLWSALGGDDKVETHELGIEWFEEFRTAIPPPRLEEMRPFAGDEGQMWMSVLGMVAAVAPAPHHLEGVISWLRSPAFADARRALVSEICWQAETSVVEAALRGDPEAIDACVGNLEEKKGANRRDVRILCELDPPELGTRLAGVLEQIDREVFSPRAAGWEHALAASAAEAERLSQMLDPKALIEHLTNGISYDLPLGTTRLVLIPSVSLRPWTLVTDHAETVIVVYPVSEEHLQADPDAPPQWVVTFYKAVGDERRLRMLRRLAEKEASLAELTEAVGLAKSTVFHHLSVLRSAGLVRVHLGGDREGTVYALREDAFTRARQALDGYLVPHPSPDEQGAGA